MRKVVFIFSLFCCTGLSAAKIKNIADLFLWLPDSLFIHTSCFNDTGSFPLKEREEMLRYRDSEMISGPFSVSEYSDSGQYLTFTNLADEYVTVALLSETANEIFFCIESKRCDFVMCLQDFHFYALRKKKVQEVKDVFPDCISTSLFFDSTYLQQPGPDSVSCMDGMEYSFTSTPGELLVDINTEFFDPELFGEGSPMTKLDPGKMIRQELILKLDGKKYVVKK